MADPEKQPAPQETTTQSQSAGMITMNVSYVKSPRGILKIIEIVLLLLAFSCAAAAHCTGDWCIGNYPFFIFATVLPWLLCIILFILFFFCLVEKIPQINWSLTVLINSVIWAILLLIAASLWADSGRKWKESFRAIGYVVSLSGQFYASVVFGFFAVIAFIIDIVFHIKLIRQ